MVGPEAGGLDGKAVTKLWVDAFEECPAVGRRGDSAPTGSRMKASASDGGAFDQPSHGIDIARVVPVHWQTCRALATVSPQAHRERR